MKVYIVYGTTDRDEWPDYEIKRTFSDYEKAVDYAIEIAVNAFNKLEVEPRHRECFCGALCSENDLFQIFDNEDWNVQIFVKAEECAFDCDSLLRGFMEYEAIFRLRDVHEIPEHLITNELIQEVTEALMDDEVFNYDFMDSLIYDVLKKRGIRHA